MQGILEFNSQQFKRAALSNRKQEHHLSRVFKYINKKKVYKVKCFFSLGIENFYLNLSMFHLYYHCSRVSLSKVKRDFQIEKPKFCQIKPEFIKMTFILLYVFFVESKITLGFWSDSKLDLFLVLY